MIIFSMISEILSLPFMQRALIAGIALGALLASLGVLATLRKMSFFGEGIAHASLAGIAIAIFAGLAPLPIGIVWAILIAILIYFFEQKTDLASDALIGIFFTASMAIGVIIMQFTPGYQPELLSFLFGNILSITPQDLTIIVSISILILLWFAAALKPLTYLALSEESAVASGISKMRYNLTFYIALAIATVLGVKILGIVLVSAMIVLPPATARLLTTSFKSYVGTSIIISEIMIITGLILSYIYDLPSGATIVLSGTALFALAVITPKRT
jgi:zinc transport system permease protein